MNKISFSNKITVLSFILSISIVYIHSVWDVKNNLLTIVRLYFFNLQNICVPMFFFISGYLFYRNFSMDKLSYKYKKRVKTLVIPYLIWNIVAFIYSYLIMKICGAKVIIPTSFIEIILSILNADYSILWFVKHLIIFTVIAPGVYIIFCDKKRGVVGLLIAFILLYYSIQSGVLKIPVEVTSNSIWLYLYEGIYYLVGAYFSLNWKKQCESINQHRSWACLVGLVILFLFNIYITIFGISIFIMILYRLLFCIFAFFAFDLFPNIEIKWWMKISFFIYCTHMYLLQISQQLIMRLFSSDLIKVLSYLVMPFFSVIFCIGIAKIFIKHFPKWWNILTGNRGN